MLSWTRVQKHFSLTETQATYNDSSARNNGDWSQCHRESLRNTPKDFPRWSPIQLLTRPTGLNFGEKIVCGVLLCAKLMEIKCFPNNVLLFRAVFKWLSKVITWLRLLRLVIGLKASRQFFNQWESKPKPIAPCTRDFSRASSELQVVTRNCDWFIALRAPVVIRRSNCFGFGFDSWPLVIQTEQGPTLETTALISLYRKEQCF